MAPEVDPRHTDEWRVEVHLQDEGHHESFGKKLSEMRLDDEAEKLLGGSIIVTRDGPDLFLYAWHEHGAREAERVMRNLIEHEGFAAEVELKRWHPGADEWRPADEPVPTEGPALDAEVESHEERARKEVERTGHYDWEAILELPSLRAAHDFERVLEDKGLPVRRRFRYLLVGSPTEEEARALADELDEISPDGTAVGYRANPSDIPHPLWVRITAMKPGAVRDLGL